MEVQQLVNQTMGDRQSDYALLHTAASFVSDINQYKSMT